MAMDFFLNLETKKFVPAISYRDKIMLTGSCFTEHIGNTLSELKFPVLQNPNGILFGPDAVCKSLLSYIDPVKYEAGQLFYLNETWNSWDHHTRFSAIQPADAIENINRSQQQAHEFLKKADWLIITLGSAFTYKLDEVADKATLSIGDPVANCHRAPASWFNKRLNAIEEITTLLTTTIADLKSFNPGLRIIFTISPVRHIRDGVTDNNRSKARLIEAVHKVVEENESCYYFPAYELVIDVLRDYRFYDVDLVHPNYSATSFVFEKFMETSMEKSTIELVQEVKKLVTARKHKPQQPATNAHRIFLDQHLQKAKALQDQNPFLDLSDEILYFGKR